MKKNSVSVVIPTKNRIESISRALNAIYIQTNLPKEIIIIDSSNPKLISDNLPKCPEEINLIIKYSKPSVCLQRNIGIDLSNGEFILLCDDDIEFDLNYIEECIKCFNLETTDVVSGLVLHKNHETNEWAYIAPEPNTLKLIYTYIFGLPLITNFTNNSNKSFIYKKLISVYLKKGNHITKSGWPIITNVNGPQFKTSIFGLGASMFKASILKKLKYDQVFCHNGIGDNYDLSLRIKEHGGILVNTNIKALHHKELSNRIKKHESYYYRGLALHYVINKLPLFYFINKLYFFWSLIGASFLFLMSGNFIYFKTNNRLIIHIIMNKNPYIR